MKHLVSSCHMVIQVLRGVCCGCARLDDEVNGGCPLLHNQLVGVRVARF